MITKLTVSTGGTRSLAGSGPGQDCEASELFALRRRLEKVRIISIAKKGLRLTWRVKVNWLTSTTRHTVRAMAMG